MLRAFGSAFLIAFFGLGMSVSSYSLWSCFEAYQAQSWPSVPGVIVSDNCRDGPDRTAYHDTKYRYVVDSKGYVNDRDHFGLRISSNECSANFSAGQSIVVFYHPANPAESALKPGEYRQGIFGFLIGFAFMLFSIVAIRHERAVNDQARS